MDGTKCQDDRKVSETLEALLCGLCIMTPEDPWTFAVSKLLSLAEGRHSSIEWDMFIDSANRPKRRLIFSSNIGSLMDENSQPTPEMYEKAFFHRRNKLFRLFFDAWMQYHEMVRAEKQKEKQDTAVALMHYRRSFLQVHLVKWKAASSRLAMNKKKAIVLLQHVAAVNVCRKIFKMWLETTRVTSQSRKWFRSRELGAEGEKDSNAWCYHEGEDPISLLPVEVSTKIFTMAGLTCALCCASVCRSWKEIIDHPLMWNRLDLSEVKNCLSDEDLLKLISRCRPFLGHLNLRGCALLTPQSFSVIGRCQNLQDLNVSECAAVMDHSLNLLAGCPGLLYLNLSSSMCLRALILFSQANESSLDPDDTLKDYPSQPYLYQRYCTNLRYLSISFCDQFTSKGLHYLFVGKGCKKVTYLDMSGCEQLTPEGMRFVGGAFPVLNTIILDDIRSLSDEMMVAFISQCQTLRHVSMKGGSLLTDRAMKMIVLQSRKLKSIKLENNVAITDLSLKALGKACRNLECISLAGCSKVTDHGLKGLHSLKSLISLNVADCVRISDLGVRHLIDSPSGRILRELNLTNCYKISDVTILRLSQRCHDLAYACFSYCEHITDAGVELLGQLRSIVHLDLRGCNISDEGVAALHHNPRLTHLNLSECGELTDTGIERMVVGLAELESLDLSESEQISDSSIRQVAFHCPLLVSVSLCGCQQVTDASVKYLTQGCTHLNSLDLSQCSVSDASFKHLKKAANLKRLDILGCPKVSRDAVIRFRGKCNIVNFSQELYPSQANFDFPSLNS